MATNMIPAGIVGFSHAFHLSGTGTDSHLFSDIFIGVPIVLQYDP